ncbi:diguanylate cyclase [uncultured Azohydromonas sp.]|jgi:diguanylate cyclase (GGDEF) domain|uniref:GGDEF domain-containing protein n=1 Tax=uncultured Azohydromonas sp. TaxID=487342 RepID=UPI00261C59A7|nr:GGDEF domain-containing protein [uncultured Azohydromonas sp.]
MLHLDPSTILVTNALYALALLMVVLTTRVGLGPAARGLEFWLAGDILLLVGTSLPMLAGTFVDAGPFQRLPETLASALMVIGVTLHLLAVRCHQRPGCSPITALSMAGALGVMFAMVCGVLGEVARPLTLQHGVLIVLDLLTFASLLRARRFWGVRLVMGALLVACAFNLSELSSSAQVSQQASQGLVFGMLMMLLATSAFVLWLQEELREHLTLTAVTDALTGTLNRHGLLPQLQRELARAVRCGAPVSVALCDLDHFKRINDRHGHAAGDDVLKRFTQRSRTLLRAGDLLGRWGGEEFLFVMPDTACAEAVRVVKRLRQSLARADDDGVPRVTFSAGVACAGDDDGGYDLDDLLARADARLYVAKETRDRIVGMQIRATPQNDELWA